MQYFHVKWVESDETDQHRCISMLGGDDFEHSILDAIMNLHHGVCRYWFVHEGRPEWIVLDCRPGPAYLRAETDVSEPDMLLSLAGARIKLETA